MSTQWYVLIEENVNQGVSWRLTQMYPTADFEHALSLAQQAAHRYVPHNPMRPKSRALFRTQDGGWLVWVEGTTTNFHFRVSVAEYYGQFPGKPSA